MTHLRKVLLISGAALLLPFALLTTYYLLHTVPAAAQTFNGPGACAAGQCQGALGTDSKNNIGIGAGATGAARLYVYSTTTNAYAIMASGTIYSVSGGIKFPDGTTQTTAAVSNTTLTAANVSAGAFGSNTGNGGYSFPAALTLNGTTTFPGNGVWNALGNVGIGTATPAQKLDVSGGMVRIVPTYGSPDTGYSTFLKMGYDTSDSYIYTIRRNGITGYLEFTGAQTGNVGYTFNGNVGIGTTNPTSKLVVAGPTGTTLNLYGTDNASGNLNTVSLMHQFNYTGTSQTSGANISFTRASTIDGDYGSLMTFTTRANGFSAAETE